MLNVNNGQVKYVIYDEKVVNKFTVNGNTVYEPLQPIDGLLDLTGKIDITDTTSYNISSDNKYLYINDMRPLLNYFRNDPTFDGNLYITENILFENNVYRLLFNNSTINSMGYITTISSSGYYNNINSIYFNQNTLYYHSNYYTNANNYPNVKIGVIEGTTNIQLPYYDHITINDVGKYNENEYNGNIIYPNNINYLTIGTRLGGQQPNYNNNYQNYSSFNSPIIANNVNVVNIYFLASMKFDAPIILSNVTKSLGIRYNGGYTNYSGPIILNNISAPNIHLFYNMMNQGSPIFKINLADDVSYNSIDINIYNAQSVNFNMKHSNYLNAAYFNFNLYAKNIITSNFSFPESICARNINIWYQQSDINTIIDYQSLNLISTTSNTTLKSNIYRNIFKVSFNNYYDHTNSNYNITIANVNDLYLNFINIYNFNVAKLFLNIALAMNINNVHLYSDNRNSLVYGMFVNKIGNNISIYANNISLELNATNYNNFNTYINTLYVNSNNGLNIRCLNVSNSNIYINNIILGPLCNKLNIWYANTSNTKVNLYTNIYISRDINNFNIINARLFGTLNLCDITSDKNITSYNSYIQNLIINNCNLGGITFTNANISKCYMTNTKKYGTYSSHIFTGNSFINELYINDDMNYDKIPIHSDYLKISHLYINGNSSIPINASTVGGSTYIGIVGNCHYIHFLNPGLVGGTFDNIATNSLWNNTNAANTKSMNIYLDWDDDYGVTATPFQRMYSGLVFNNTNIFVNTSNISRLCYRLNNTNAINYWKNHAPYFPYRNYNMSNTFNGFSYNGNRADTIIDIHGYNMNMACTFSDSNISMINMSSDNSVYMNNTFYNSNITRLDLNIENPTCIHNIFYNAYIDDIYLDVKNFNISNYSSPVYANLGIPKKSSNIHILSEETYNFIMAHTENTLYALINEF